MPFSGNRWDDERLVGEREALAAARRAHPGLARAPDEPCRTASVSHCGLTVARGWPPLTQLPPPVGAIAKYEV